MAIRIVDLCAETMATVERDAAQATTAAPMISFEVPGKNLDDDRAALLGRLRDAQDVTAEEIVLRDIARFMRPLDPLSIAVVRDEVVSILTKHGRSSPARIADAALVAVVRPQALAPQIVRSVEPWPDAVDGAELLHDIAASISRHVALPSGAEDAAGLWVVHTYLFDRHMISPRLALLSPEKRCGKTTLLGLLGELCDRPLSTANLTGPVMFRVIESIRPTLLIDEADTFLPEAQELRGVINAGYRRGGSVLRCDGDDNEPRPFACYGPVALAAIGRLPDTIIDRSILIEMRRRGRGEHVERFRFDRVEPFRDLARRCARWTVDHGDHLDLDPAMPEPLHDRARDNWRVLLSIADRAGGDWPQRARNAALALSALGTDDESIRVTLLGDIRAIFDAHGLDRIATAELLAELHGMDHRSWGDWSHGKSMTPHALGRQLRAFKISSRQWRDGSIRERGYERADFADAWERYL